MLEITTTHRPATDLGFLLAKHPDRCQTFPLAFGQAHVVYRRAEETCCTVALLLDVDPVGLVRGRGTTLSQYVNDRPYAASSFLSVAIAQVFGSALQGRSRERQELAETAIPLRARLPVLPCRGGEGVLRGLFEPLGYEIEASRLPLDPAFPDWGESRYFDVTLTAETRLAALLGHLYVLVPVLDNDKHYFVGEKEVDKLLRHGEGWLAEHPERDAIVHRYLKRRRNLARAALSQLRDEEATEEDDTGDRSEEALEKPIRLHDRRLDQVAEIMAASGATSVIDLGCGDGKLLRRLRSIKTLERIVGLDVSPGALEFASRRLRLDEAPVHQRDRIRLVQGSVTYRDDRLEGFDAAALVEVIEHLEPDRLDAATQVVFGHARPGLVIVTTPNADYNVRFENLAAGAFRHPDHRFEWSREEFRAWVESVGERFGYAAEIQTIGDEDPEVGTPTQMALFHRQATP